MELLRYSQLLGHWKKLLEKEAHLANKLFEWHWHNGYIGGLFFAIFGARISGGQYISAY
jgi:hypothetical protein